MSFVNILSLCVRASFLFALEGWMCDLIVLIPNHCLVIDFSKKKLKFFLLSLWQDKQLSRYNMVRFMSY